MDSIVSVLFTGILVTGIGYWTVKGFCKEAKHIKHGCCGSGSSGCSGACGTNCGCSSDEVKEK